jgi:hypothetical protein
VRLSGVATRRWWSDADAPTAARLSSSSRLRRSSGRRKPRRFGAGSPRGQVPLVWGYDAALGALLLEAIPSEIPLSELGMAVELDEVASLIGRLHRSGAPLVGTGVESFAERVEFIFEHWIERHCRRGEVVTGAVPVERLRRATSSRGSLLPMLVYRCCSMGTCIRATCFMAARRAAWSPSTPVPAWERPLLTPWTGCSGRWMTRAPGSRAATALRWRWA